MVNGVDFPCGSRIPFWLILHFQLDDKTTMSLLSNGAEKVVFDVHSL